VDGSDMLAAFTTGAAAPGQPNSCQHHANFLNAAREESPDVSTA
jgi:hypothetical protein